MLLSVALLALFAQLFALGVVAHKDWWLQGLSQCSQTCFSATEDGCSSSKCICSTSENSASYLSSAVSCAVSKCDADGWALELVLGPLQLYCAAIDCPIPDTVMSSAYAAASETATPPQSTRKPTSSAESTKSKQKMSTASDDGPDLTSTIRSTITRTTIDDSGHTLQVIVPIVIGPSGMVTGTMSISTLSGGASSSATPSAAPASPSPSAVVSSPSLTQSLSTSMAGSRETESPARGNGSPFENMQAGAGKWVVSEALLGLGALTVLFMRL